MNRIGSDAVIHGHCGTFLSTNTKYVHPRFDLRRTCTTTKETERLEILYDRNNRREN